MMANDHYIPRFLTSPWETTDGKRDLVVYYRGKSKFERKSSKALFARPGINPPELETLYNQILETPISQFLRDQAKRMPEPGQPVELTWPEKRAFYLLQTMTVQRMMEANGVTKYQHLTTAENCEAIAHHWMQTHEIISIVLNNAMPLFFPENVYVAVPLVAAPPLLWIPVSPTQAFAIVDRKHLRNNRDIVNAEMASYLSAMSVGLGESIHRVIVPPAFHEAALREPQGLIEHIEMLRTNGKQIFNLVAQMNEIAGFHPWRLQ